MDPSKMIKTGATAVGLFQLIRNGIGLLIAIAAFNIFFAPSLPWYITVPANIVLVIFLVLQIIEFKRITSVNVTAPEIPTINNIPQNQPFESSEQIQGFIAPIIKTGFGVRGVGILGKGEIQTPENSLIVTNTQILVMMIPLPGSDKLIAGTDVGMWQFTLSKKEIEAKLQEIISKNALMAIFNSNQKNYSIEKTDIEKVTLNGLMKALTIKTKSGKTYSYGVRDQENIEKAKTLFAQYIN